MCRHGERGGIRPKEQEDQGVEMWLFVHNRCYHSVYIQQHMKFVATVADEEKSDIMTYWLLLHGELCLHVVVHGYKIE